MKQDNQTRSGRNTFFRKCDLFSFCFYSIRFRYFSTPFSLIGLSDVSVTSFFPMTSCRSFSSTLVLASVFRYSLTFSIFNYGNLSLALVASFLTLSDMLFFLVIFLLESCLVLFRCSRSNRSLWKLLRSTSRLAAFLLLSSESILWESDLEGCTSFCARRSYKIFSFLSSRESLCSSSDQDSASAFLGNLQYRLCSERRYLMLISIMVLILILSSFFTSSQEGLQDLIIFMSRLCRTIRYLIISLCRRLSIPIIISLGRGIKVQQNQTDLRGQTAAIGGQQFRNQFMPEKTDQLYDIQAQPILLTSVKGVVRQGQVEYLIQFTQLMIIQMMIVARGTLSPAFYFATATRRGRKANADRTSFEAPLEKDVFKAYRSQVEKTSVLRQFREEVFRRAELSSEWENQKKREVEEQKQFAELIHGKPKEESINNAKKIEERLTSKRNVFHENNSRSLLSDYGDYTAYNKVYPTLQDRNLGENEYLRHQHGTENLYKFIDKLPDHYVEKSTLKHQMKTLPYKYTNMSLTQYGHLLQRKFNDTQDQIAELNEQQRVHHADKMQLEEAIYNDDLPTGQQPHAYTGVVKTVDPYNGQENLDATLSPRAVDTIYELYLQGWTVRDISKRFGILPARTKFCVWVRAQLYHEVIPKMGVQFYLRGLRYEQKFYDGKAFCDYGLDLDELSNEGIVSEITEWNGNMLDAQRKEQEYLGAMMRLTKEKRFSKYEMVEVGTHGSENSKYRLKEWVIFRGKGSDDHFLKNKAFRELSKAQKKFNKVYY